MESDDSNGIHNTNSQIKFKATVLKLSLCDCNNAYILDKQTITISGLRDNAATKQAKRNKEAIFI